MRYRVGVLGKIPREHSAQSTALSTMLRAPPSEHTAVLNSNTVLSCTLNYNTVFTRVVKHNTVLTCALNSNTVLTCALNRNTEMRYRIGLLLKPP